MTTDNSTHPGGDPSPSEEESGGPFQAANDQNPTIKLDVSVEEDPRLGELTNAGDRYAVMGELGAGGMATVWAALDPNLGRQIAVKTLHTNLGKQGRIRGRFVREARIMAQLEHPNIVPVHELGMREDGSLYFTMKRVKGVTLRHVLSQIKQGREKYILAYPHSRLLDIFIDMCQAVAFAHSRGIMHRDLKPENILIGSYGEVLVMDWGLARMMDDRSVERDAREDDIQPWMDGMDPLHSMDGHVTGSPRYMSPEQAQGQNAAMDHRSDIYSLGTMLYEMLTQQTPARGTKVKEVLYAVVHDPVVPPRKRSKGQSIPRELDAICIKALAKAPTDRYQDLEMMHQDLKRFRQGLPVSVYKAPWPQRFRKACLRHPVISAAVLAAVVATLTSFASMFYAREQRLGGLLAMATEHRLAGNEIYDQKIIRTQELQALQTAKTNGAPNAIAEALADEVRTLHDQSENEYELALILYGSVSQARSSLNTEVYDGQREILTRRIEYACSVGNFREAQKWLDLIRLAVERRYDEPPERLRKLLQSYEQLIEHTQSGPPEPPQS